MKSLLIPAATASASLTVSVVCLLLTADLYLATAATPLLQESATIAAREVTQVGTEHEKPLLVAIAIQNDFSTVSRMSIAPVVHLTCFRSCSRDEKEESSKRKEECCFEMWRVTRDLCPASIAPTADLPPSLCFKVGDWVPWCSTLSALVPNALKRRHDHRQTPGRNDDATGRRDLCHFSYLAVPNRATKPTHFNTTRPNGLQYEDQYHYSADSPSASVSPIRVHTPIINNEDNFIAQHFHAFVESFLSNEGGMHRSFRHQLSIRLPPLPNQSDVDTDSTRPVSVTGLITMLLPLSQGLFIDVNEPFQLLNEDFCQLSSLPTDGKDRKQSAIIKHESCKVALKSVPHSIDIEQPAFASPQHAVALQVSLELQLLMTGEVSTSEEVRVEFVTLVHVRYPLPIVSNNQLHDDLFHSGFVPVHVSTPYLYSGTLQIANKNNSTIGDLQLDLLDLALWENRTIANGIIVLEAAAGLDSNHDLVMIITILSMVLGAMITLRDISKVSVWF